jgi:hypothetical protein
MCVYAVSAKESRIVLRSLHLDLARRLSGLLLSFLEVLPFVVTSMLLCLHWDQARALVGRSPEAARFSLRRKPRGLLSQRYVWGNLAAVGAFVVVPYAEELWRC